jgi:hypothetical protein
MRIRTADLHITNVSLYQLSYIGLCALSALKRPWTFLKASLDVSKSGAQRYASASYRLRLAQEFCHFDFAGRVAGLEELLACDLIG